MCIFDECDTPFEIYSSSKEWMSHMRSKHRMRWHCFATSHEPSFFESPDVLEEHLKEIHAGHFSSEEISLLIKNSSHPSLSVIEHCPFCPQIAENIEEHVARHLVQFALRSLPWPDDCSNTYHASHASRGGQSEGSGSISEARETTWDEDNMTDIRKTNWDAWEIQAEGDSSISDKNQQHDRPFLAGEGINVVGLNDIMSLDYDAADDKLLEPFRQRAKFGKDSSAQQPLSERQATVRNFIHQEAVFTQVRHKLVDMYRIYGRAMRNFLQLDETTSLDRLLSIVNNLAILHQEFLKELRMIVSFDWETIPFPVSCNTMVSSSPAQPELIGTVILENLRGIEPARDEYCTFCDRAMSEWYSIWIK